MSTQVARQLGNLQLTSKLLTSPAGKKRTSKMGVMHRMNSTPRMTRLRASHSEAK